MSRLRRLAKKLSISVVSLAVTVVVAELVLRAQEPGPFTFVDRNPYEESATDGHVRHIKGFRGRWDSTWYEIDSRGFRGPERTPDFAASELRIACLGDSCTFGKGVLEKDSWPRQLETRLRAEGRDADVFNMGINGANGRVYRSLLTEHVAALKPQVVVVGYNINDFPNTIQAVDEKVYEERTLRRIVPQDVRDALGRTALYRKAREIYYDSQKASDWAAAEEVARRATAAPLDSAVWDQQRALLQEIASIAAEHGARTMVFLFPYESQVYLESYDKAPIERLAEVCAGLDLPFVDLAEEFRQAARKSSPPAALFIPGDRYHPNGAGYTIVAERVLGVLREREWLSGL